MRKINTFLNIKAWRHVTGEALNTVLNLNISVACPLQIKSIKIELLDRYTGRRIYIASFSLSAIPLLHKHSQSLLSHPAAQHLFVLLLTFISDLISPSPLYVCLPPSLSASGHQEVEIKAHRAASEVERSNCCCLRGQIYKTQNDIDKQCPVSSEIGFPSNLPSLLFLSFGFIYPQCHIQFNSPASQGTTVPVYFSVNMAEMARVHDMGRSTTWGCWSRN